LNAQHSPSNRCAYGDEIGPVKGALSPGTMRRINAGLAAALSLPQAA